MLQRVPWAPGPWGLPRLPTTQQAEGARWDVTDSQMQHVDQALACGVGLVDNPPMFLSLGSLLNHVCPSMACDVCLQATHHPQHNLSSHASSRLWWPPSSR